MEKTVNNCIPMATASRKGSLLKDLMYRDLIGMMFRGIEQRALAMHTGI
jgi:hypothetical protein